MFASSGLSGPAASEEKAVMPKLDEVPLESEVSSPDGEVPLMMQHR